MAMALASASALASALALRVNVLVLLLLSSLLLPILNVIAEAATDLPSSRSLTCSYCHSSLTIARMAQQVLATLILALCLSWASAAFNCSLYASTCSGTTGYTACSSCSDTVAANLGGMACRIYQLDIAAMAGNATEHCPHAAQDATGDCATEVLKSFDCSFYVSKCSRTTGYTAYSRCSGTVAANPMGMACCIYHLGVAAMAGNATDHCPHAAQDAMGPCATEVLKSVNCNLYASTCSGTTGYTAYSGCSDTVAANPLGMACRTYHLGVAAMAGNAEHKTPRALALPKFLRASTAVSTPPRAAELQATRLIRVAATQLPPTQWAWLAAIRILANQTLS
jgi:hypothetical protein